MSVDVVVRAIIHGHVGLPATDSELTAAMGELECDHSLARSVDTPTELGRATPPYIGVLRMHKKAAIHRRECEKSAVVRETARDERAAKVRRHSSRLAQTHLVAQQRETRGSRYGCNTTCRSRAHGRDAEGFRKRRHVESVGSADEWNRHCAQMRSQRSAVGVSYDHQEAERCAARHHDQPSISRACDDFSRRRRRKTEARQDANVRRWAQQDDRGCVEQRACPLQAISRPCKAVGEAERSRHAQPTSFTTNTLAE